MWWVGWYGVVVGCSEDASADEVLGDDNVNSSAAIGIIRALLLGIPREPIRSLCAVMRSPLSQYKRCSHTLLLIRAL